MISDSNHNNDYQALEEKYENALERVLHMRKTYPASCAKYLSSSRRNDMDMLMRAEVVPNERTKDPHLPHNLDYAKLEKLNENTTLESFANKAEELRKQNYDIRFALNQIRAARHKNVQE